MSPAGTGTAPGPGAPADTPAALAAVWTAPSVLAAIGRTEALVAAAGRDRPERAVAVLETAVRNRADEVAAIAAVHALAAVPAAGAGDHAGAVLTELLVGGLPWLREHAGWALARRTPVPAAVPALVRRVADGGFPGMLAQRTLQTWAAADPGAVGRAVGQELDQDPAHGLGPGSEITHSRAVDGRARLVETLGLVPGPAAAARLRALTADPREDPTVRATSLEALAERRETDEGGARALRDLLVRCAAADAPLAAVARLAQAGPADPPPAAGPGGLTVAQAFLHAELDPRLSHAGRGDAGGIATLLVRLGDALTVPPPGPAPEPGAPRVGRVLTISRGDHDTAAAALPGLSRDAHAFAAVPFLGPAQYQADAWPRRVAAERGIRRALRATGRVDVLHLRMADVGSMAAAAVARERGIPVVLTMAPDPHAQVAAREAAGALTRAGFGAVDHVEHLWFRIRLLAELAEQAAHVVLFPRPDLARDTRQLLDLDLTARPGRHTVVPEGIDLRGIERAATEVPAHDADPADPAPSPGTARALAALDDVLATLPPSRRGLPVVVTVGRVHRVKGTATLVRAWAGNALLRQRCNLLVVGGDLQRPNLDEHEQLDRIHALVPPQRAAAEGLLLAGHRPNDVATTWLAAVLRGRPGLAAPHGIYVCASLKEEFGIALLEAMATGLTVVAPASGGPATFVEDGVSGLLLDTADPAALAAGIGAALDLAAGPGAAAAARTARATVRDRFGIEVMASALTRVYARAVQDAAPGRSPRP